jgi:hypothetical protein
MGLIADEVRLIEHGEYTLPGELGKRAVVRETRIVDRNGRQYVDLNASESWQMSLRGKHVTGTGYRDRHNRYVAFDGGEKCASAKTLHSWFFLKCTFRK